jgi:bifunctional non-homologous end joining protein LigD
MVEQVASRTRPAQVMVDGLMVRLTNLDRVLWPEDGITKGQLIDYLVSMAPYIIPHLSRRPLVLTRYPDGIHGESFYQKNTPDTAPPWLGRFRSQPDPGGRPINYAVADCPAALAWLGNQAAIEIHPWFSRAESPDVPDIAVFDLDPVAPAGFNECRPVARVLRQALAAMGIEGWLKTSGATGLHLYVPIVPAWPYRDIAWSVGRVLDIVHETLPDITTRVRRVAARPPGTVYLDHLQNVRGKTLAMVYGPRPRAGAPASAPIAWEELDSFVPQSANLRTMRQRVAAVGDLFAPVADEGRRQDWGRVMRYLGGPL